MAERNKNLRDDLIQAGIDEININGANGFSFRRVADACHVSSAAPYRHFKDKKEFISAIVDFVNNQWFIVQDEVLAACSDDPRDHEQKRPQEDEKRHPQHKTKGLAKVCESVKHHRICYPVGAPHIDQFDEYHGQT